MRYHPAMMKRPAFFLFLLVFLLDGCATKVGAGRQKAISSYAHLAKTNRPGHRCQSRRSDGWPAPSGGESFIGAIWPSGRAGVQPGVGGEFGFFPGNLNFPELEGLREGAAAMLAFSPKYQGDRVLAVVAGLLNWSTAAF